MSPKCQPWSDHKTTAVVLEKPYLRCKQKVRDSEIVLTTNATTTTTMTRRQAMTSTTTTNTTATATTSTMITTTITTTTTMTAAAAATKPPRYSLVQCIKRAADLCVHEAGGRKVGVPQLAGLVVRHGLVEAEDAAVESDAERQGGGLSSCTTP